MSGQWCNHYRAMAETDTCAAGVKYADVRKDHDPPLRRVRLAKQGTPVGDGYPVRVTYPCFARDRDNCLPCAKCQFPTPEEIAAEEAASRNRFAACMLARMEIVKSLGGPWKKGMPGAQGKINCPACGAEKALRFSRAGYNGHIHAACSTKGCVQWME